MSQHIIKHFIRGGQIIFHNLRMLMQTSKNILLISLLLFIILNMFYVAKTTTPFERHIVKTWLYAQIIKPLNAQTPLNFTQANGQTLTIKADQFLTAPPINTLIITLKQRFITQFMISLLLYLFTMIMIVIALKRYGKAQSQDQHIKGDRLASAEQVKQLISTEGSSNSLHISQTQLPLPVDIECTHFLISGSTGAGKSNLIKECLTQLRDRGDKVIIYDKSADFLTNFYDSSQDLLLNPLDKRSATWNLWSECREPAHFDTMAAALIPLPSTHGDPFWIHAARSLFAAAAYKIATQAQSSLSTLLTHLLQNPLAQLAQFLKDTPAASLITPNNEKTALSIRTTLNPYLKSLSLIKESSNPIAIRNFIKACDDPGWLFITSTGEHHETLRPLITVWLDMAVNAILSLPPQSTTANLVNTG